MTGDHFITKYDLDRGFDGETCGLVLADVFSDELCCAACSDESREEAYVLPPEPLRRPYEENQPVL